MDKKKDFQKLKNPKSKGGRPSKYKKEYCQLMINWFSRDLTREVEVEKIEYGKAVKINEIQPNYPPMFGAFAREIGVSHATLIDWTKKNKEFLEAYNECKQIQRDHIVMGCLMGIYNANFGRFTMKNISEWRDKIETHIDNGKGGLKLAYKLEANK